MAKIKKATDRSEKQADLVRKRYAKKGLSGFYVIRSPEAASRAVPTRSTEAIRPKTS